MKQDNALYLIFYKNIAAEFHHLTINQISDVIWSMIRVKHNDRAVVMAIYKKLHQVVNNHEKIILYKENQQLPSDNSSSSSLNDQQTEKIHHMYEGSFVRLVWALQKTTIIDSKLTANLLKHVLKDKENQNMEKIRIQNLSLLAYCIFQVKIQRYRITESIINQIMKCWQQLPALSTLSLSLLCETFSKFINYKIDFNNKYQKDWTPEQIAKKNQFLQKEKKFVYLIIETIFLRQDQDLETKGNEKNQNQDETQQNSESNLIRLVTPLSGKFSSKILYNLARVGMYNKNIWFKLLKSITDDIDHVETLDLSMSLSAVCDFAKKDFIPEEDLNKFIYYHKKIITRRMFQIYSSLTGRTLQILKEFVRNKKIGKQLIPSWIRKEIQKQFASEKVKHQEYDQQQQKTNQNNDFKPLNGDLKNQQFSSKKNAKQQQKKQKNLKNSPNIIRKKYRKKDQEKESTIQNDRNMKQKQKEG